MLQIKICGITTEDYLIRLINYNITWAGFVFYEKSVRNVKLNQSSLFRISKNKIGRVALFVSPKDNLLETVVKTMQPDLIQLHGSENPERCANIKKRFGIPVMKALHINDQSSFEKKLALAQFGLALAGGKSMGGKPFPILAEAGQQLIQNISKKNSEK